MDSERIGAGVLDVHRVLRRQQVLAVPRASRVTEIGLIESRTRECARSAPAFATRRAYSSTHAPSLASLSFGGSAFRSCASANFTDPIGPAAPLDVEVREPVTRHTLTLMQLERWLQGAVTNPAEKVKKERLKALLR